MKTRIVLILTTLPCAVMGSVQSARASTITVINTNDSGPGSLGQALADANDGDTIDATGVSGTILLTSGALQINAAVTINGPGAGTLAVNGNRSSRVFENHAFGSVTISGFTITNGRSGGILNTGHWNIGGEGILTVTNCTISGNSSNYGGGIVNYRGLTISNSTISGNSASYGGGIVNYAARGLTISNSTISGNLADVDGGGLYNSRGGQISPVLVSIENSTYTPAANGSFVNSAPDGHFIAEI